MEDKVHFRFISNCDLLSIIEFMQKKGRIFSREQPERPHGIWVSNSAYEHAGNMFF